MMFVGLKLTYEFRFQVLSGSEQIFYALLKVVFLQRRLAKFEMAGIIIEVVGLGIVGAADFWQHGDDDTHPRISIMTGDVLIITAEIIMAVQNFYNEKYVATNIPIMQADGYTGIFGIVTLCEFLLPLQTTLYQRYHTIQQLEDLPDALVQICKNWKLMLLIGLTVLMVPLYKIYVRLAKEKSATTQMAFCTVQIITRIISLIRMWHVDRHVHV